MKEKVFAVSTSIFKPSIVYNKIVKFNNINLIVVGDLKTPNKWKMEGVTYLSPAKQDGLKYNILKLLPWNHYSRKLVGYLYAIQQGADIILDIDDDNLPYRNWGEIPKEKEYNLVSNIGPVNVYSFFTENHVWPRGFPLESILSEDKFKCKNVLVNKCLPVGIWQSLVDGNTDVDAIYRLTNNKPVKFEVKKPLVLSPNTWCPFNSQNTLFTKEMFPLLYLPGYVSFRFTDILRGLVAQPVMWSAGRILGFTQSTTKQERNPHHLLSDFESEIPFYLHSSKIMNIAQKLVSKKNSIDENLLSVYQGLHREGIVSLKELSLLQFWLSDLESLFLEE